MKELENKLSSREVAEMMDMEHSKLLRKIDGINVDFTQAKIGFSKYWNESTYIDGSGKSNKEYQITKKGCEFLAHKTTGTKGNLFTDKYMDKFALMELAINDNQLASLDMTNKIAEIVQTQLKEQFNNQVEMVDSKYSYYIRPTALTKRSFSDYIKKRLGVSLANDEYELVKRRLLISLGAKAWQDVPVEVLKDSIKLIDECIDVIKKDRPYQQMSLI